MVMGILEARKEPLCGVAERDQPGRRDFEYSMSVFRRRNQLGFSHVEPFVSIIGAQGHRKLANTTISLLGLLSTQSH